MVAGFLARTRGCLSLGQRAPESVGEISRLQSSLALAVLKGQPHGNGNAQAGISPGEPKGESILSGGVWLLQPWVKVGGRDGQDRGKGQDSWGQQRVCSVQGVRKQD